ncbi:response regulator [Sulfitobacter sp. MF3-043]|uniref:response regulator n=1 Tax=Sulfitobacter sediminivivens TaxID=3252902 RepID=UPI0036DAC719
MFQEMPSNEMGPIVMPPHKPIRALLLDDSNFDRERIRRMSSKTELGVHLDEVGSIEELDTAVRQASYDLIMIDYRLPVGDGMKALSHILDDPLNRDAGKIMITGDAAVDTAVQAMRGGCHDFLTKESMNADILREAMLNAMTVARQRIQMQMQTEHQRDIIRQGLIAALNDIEIQGNVVSMIREKLAQTPSNQARPMSGLDASEIDALLAGFADEDEFVFH